MTVARSRRAGISAEEARQRPMYAKVLGLQHLRPGNLVCFVFFEGAVALAALLALAELADWWVMLVLPLSVAAMVKLSDMIAGAVLRADSVRPPKALGRAAVPSAAAYGRPRRGATIPPASAGMTSVTRAGRTTSTRASGAAPAAPTSLAGVDEWLGSPEQRARQSAVRRYE
ncbi:MAG TPA: hypothetical protein VFC19_05260 [Candidatus Limnocylindrales bacterium]|nr:hypothetical protein [Candidatus Limnocylindrales bacterium]